MSSPSYEFIESAIIFGITDYDKLKNFTYHSNDFAKHGDAFKFLGEYLDKYDTFPSEEVLMENFPTLNPSAKTQSLEYSLDIFKNQVLQRAVVTTVQQQRELVKENPKQALSNIMSGLSDVDLIYDEDKADTIFQIQNAIDATTLEVIPVASSNTSLTEIPSTRSI